MRGRFVTNFQGWRAQPNSTCVWAMTMRPSPWRCAPASSASTRRCSASSAWFISVGASTKRRGFIALGQLRDAVDQADRLDKVVEPTSTLRRACDLAAELARRRAAIVKEIKIPSDQASAWDKALDAFVCAEQAHA